MLFTPDKDGFFDDLVTMVVSLSSFMFTMHVRMASNKPTPFNQRSQKEWMSYVLPLMLPEWPLNLASRAIESNFDILPIPALMVCSLGGWPQYIEYRIGPIYEPVPRNFRLSGDGVDRAASGIAGSSFTNYFAKCEPIIKDRFGTNPNDWPEPVRFAWMLRNGFAHGGKLKINDPNLRPIPWRIWAMDGSYHGRKCLFENGMLGIGDVVLLMQDLDGLVGTSS